MRDKGPSREPTGEERDTRDETHDVSNEMDYVCLVPSLSPVSSPGGSGHRLSRVAFHPAPLPPVGDRAPAGRKERGKDGERRDREVNRHEGAIRILL